MISKKLRSEFLRFEFTYSFESSWGSLVCFHHTDVFPVVLGTATRPDDIVGLIHSGILILPNTVQDFLKYLKLLQSFTKTYGQSIRATQFKNTALASSNCLVNHLHRDDTLSFRSFKDEADGSENFLCWEKLVSLIFALQGWIALKIVLSPKIRPYERKKRNSETYRGRPNDVFILVDFHLWLTQC